eukprot:gene19054-22811_t
MGGKVAMLYALLHPSTVNKLVVVDISPTDLKAHTLDDFRRYLTAMTQMDLAALKSRGEAEKAFEQVEQNTVVRRFLLTNLASGDSGYRWRINTTSLLENIGEVSKFPAPPNAKYHGDTLFVAGGNSHFISEKDHPLIYKYFPSAHIEVVPNTGHWIHAENPALFTKIASTFINQPSSGIDYNRSLIGVWVVIDCIEFRNNVIATHYHIGGTGVSDINYFDLIDDYK